MGSELRVDDSLVVPNPKLTLRQGAIAPWAKSSSPYYLQTLEALARHYQVPPRQARGANCRTEARRVILHGSGAEEIRMAYDDGLRAYEVKKPFEGVVANLDRRYRETESEWSREEIQRYMTATPCEACHGFRLKPEALAVKIDGQHIGEVSLLSVSAAIEWAKGLPAKLDPKRNEIADRILKEIVDRLTFLRDVGLDYLTLSRASGTLSGGESQRIRLASQIGSGLTGVLYVLDEPSIGLHQRDNARLLDTLRRLRGPRQYGDRGRARRGRDLGRRLCRRRRPRRRRAWRRDRRQGNAGRDRRQSQFSDRPVPQSASGRSRSRRDAAPPSRAAS